MDSLSRFPIKATLADDAQDKLYKLPKTASCHVCHCDLPASPNIQTTRTHYGQVRVSGTERRSYHVALRSTADAQVGRCSRVLDMLAATPEEGERR